MYQGYLIKILGPNTESEVDFSYTIPMGLMKAQSYNAQYITQDLDTYTDADGILHRHALEHKCPKVEFETVPMTNTQFGNFMTKLRQRMINNIERSFLVDIYIPELDDYLYSVEMYMPDISPTIYLANDTEVRYNPIRIAFIAY